MKQSFARNTFKFVVVIQPILYATLLYFMSVGENTIHGNYILCSVGVMNFWSTMIFSSAGDIERERFFGTLESIYNSPSDFRIILIGKVLGNLVFGLISLGITFSVIVFLFKLRVQIEFPFKFVISLFFIICVFGTISLFLACIFVLSRNSRIYMNCLEYPIFILSGLVFPINNLPCIFQLISKLLPTTWSVKLLNYSSGINISEYSFEFLCLIILAMTIIYVYFIKIFFRIIDKKIRLEGKLGIY